MTAPDPARLHQSIRQLEGDGGRVDVERTRAAAAIVANRWQTDGMDSAVNTEALIHDIAAALDRVAADAAAEARAAGIHDSLTEARKVISQYVATAERWRYDRVMWAFAVMLSEIPEETPCPRSPADDEWDLIRARAAELRAPARTDEEN